MADAFTIAAIPQGSTHRYWKMIQAGALKSIHDLQATGTQVELLWKGPIREGDQEEHKQIVESFVRKGVHGMMLVPFDDKFLVRTIEDAARKGIPTVVVDSELNTTQIVSFVATDNKKAGVLAADRMGELLHGKGTVFLQRYQKGSASTEAREAGFADRIARAFPNMEVILSSEFAGATRDTAKRAAEIFLSKQMESVLGVFTPNESSTTGMLMALQGAHGPHKLSFVGFDYSDTLGAGLQGKQIQGLIIQDPFRMGELGVKTLVDHLQGKSVSRRIDTGATLVTPENAASAVIRRLLSPPVPVA